MKNKFDARILSVNRNSISDLRFQRLLAEVSEVLYLKLSQAKKSLFPFDPARSESFKNFKTQKAGVK